MVIGEKYRAESDAKQDAVDGRKQLAEMQIALSGQ